MVGKKMLALSGVVAAVALAPTALAKSAPPTIRIEGKNKTLLATTAVSTTGPIVKKDGHSCPGSSGAGALTRATRGRWSGKWYSGLGFEVFTIFGETDQYATTNSYWELFVGNVAASVGLCSLKLHPREQLLLAAVRATGTEYPLGVSAPTKATVGHALTVTVKWFDSKGHAKPLASATVNGKRTDRHGIVRIVPSRTGTLILRAAKSGYIRDETSIRVS